MPGTYYTTTVEDYLHWPESNLVDPLERKWMGPLAITLQVASAPFVLGRLYLRLSSHSVSAGWDDAFIFAAWVRWVEYEFAFAQLLMGYPSTDFFHSIHYHCMHRAVAT